MVLKFYTDYLSPPCRAVALFLRCNNIPHQVIKISLTEGQHMKEDFTKINPLHKVPCIVEDDGFLLTESNAIVKYLLSKPNIPKQWYPTFAKQRAKIDEYQAWHHAGLRKSVSGVFREQVIRPLLEKTEIDEKGIAVAKKSLDEILDKVESYFLKDRDWLAGSDMTIADIFGICDLMMVVSIGYNVAGGHPRLADWMKRVQSKLNPHFDDIHKDIVALGAQFKRKRVARSTSVENGAVKK